MPAAGASPSSGSFDDYPLSPALLAAVAERGMTTPTPIQASAIPALLGGRDVVGQARTGSGKTLAFSLPLLEAVDASRASVQALVLAPTRELASQVAAVIADLGTVKGVSVALLYGGMSSGPQRTALRRGAQVAVGTPGRILDLISQGALWLDQARFVVLDEADEMFDQGFAQDVERIMDKTSNSRQTALFSATMPEWVRQTAARYLYDPETIAVDGGEERASTVPHTAYVIPTSERTGGRAGYGRGRDEADMQAKLGALRDLLDHRGEGSAIVFGRTKQGVAALSKQLDRDGYPVGALQGNMTQAERDFVMGSFREGRIDVLVATNVAARGLDLVGVNLVINVELPESAELLTHRVGRTGRMGRGGQAITLLAGADLARWQLLTRDAAFPIRQLPWEGAAAALALGEDDQADRGEQNEQAAQIASIGQPTNVETTVETTPADQTDFSDDLVEEAPIMDDPFTPEAFGETRSAGDGHPATPARSDRPTRRASRRGSDTTSTPPPAPARASDDAGDLIARALASVGAAGGSTPTPAPARRDVPAVRRSTPRPESPAAREPVPRRRDDRGQPSPAVSDAHGEPTVTAATPVSQAWDEIATPMVAPVVSGSLRGTPRPGWLRGAAERVAHWGVGASQPPATTHGTSSRFDQDPERPAIADVPAAPAAMTQPAPVIDPPARPAAPPTPRHAPAWEAEPANQFELVAEPIIEPVTEPTIQPVPVVDLLERPPVRQSRATMPPPVRRRSQTQPVEPVAAAATPDIAPPPVTDVPTPPRPEPPLIPTVRASRNRPAVAPAPEPLTSAAEPVATDVLAAVTADPVSNVAIEPGKMSAGIEEAADLITADAPDGTTDDEPDVVTDDAPSAVTTLDAESESRDDVVPGNVVGSDAGAVPEPMSASDAIVVIETPPVSVGAPESDVATPPTRRRSRASRAVMSPPDAAPSDGPETGTDTVEPAPKPTRRASSRRSRAEATTDQESGTTPADQGTDSSTPVTPADPTTTAEGAAVAPEVQPAKPARRTNAGRSRAGKATTDAEEAPATNDGSDGTDVSPPETDPDPAPPKGRGRSPRSQPEPAPEPTTPKTRGKSRSAEQTSAGSAPRGRNTEQAAPGNRRTPASRSGGDSSSGQRGQPSDADDNRGNTATPERGNSAQARPSRQSGGSPASGPPLRRRPVAAPANARCAACGTPQPKGSTRKYCPACERELAVRSQES